ncbi:MAG: 50S ribosomal protein L11 methyltransferase [Cryomorphaceae bacterium]|nr:50S ribosomal protein L11 methyltransferase [Flavobacteriales bacterium]
MKNYVCYSFLCEPQQPTGEILTGELADIGFESFAESGASLEAYISEADDDEQAVKLCIESLSTVGEIRYSRKVIPGQNWNAVWEADYPPVRVGSAVIVRAPFHPEESGFETEVVISPKMSFGTGHHATTRLMLDFLSEINLTGKRVLDMGCGTGVLAAAAMLRGADFAKAVDIEDIAVENTRENAALNNVQITVEKGGADTCGNDTFDIILANINKNVLRADMGTYAKALAQGGALLLSGFFDSDADELTEAAGDCGLKFEAMRNEDGWASLKLNKKA